MSIFKKLIKAVASQIPDINPRAVEFVLHYLQGTKEQMTLLPHEIEATRNDAIRCLMTEDQSGMKEGWFWAEPKDTVRLLRWFKDPTCGLVGGFIFRLKSWNDKFLVRAVDEWDFNDVSSEIAVPIDLMSKGAISLAKEIAKHYEVEIHVNECFLVVEESLLTKFNESRSFKTIWEFTLPEGLSCPIDRP